MFSRMKKLVVCCGAIGVLLVAGSAWACTTTMVGKKASVDGSAMVSHTVDGWYDHRIRIVPGGKHKKGEMVPIEKNICYQTMPTKPLIKMGEIPQAEVTYTYFHVGYPFMNEHQLMIGESTWGGRDETFCDAGWMVIEQLQVLALQRTKTAREAIKLMGELAEKYGYGDSGEALAIADPEEVWLFEICGPGPLWKPGSDKPGANWVARRIPDDCISVIANRARIGEIDWDDKENFMYSENVRDFAKEQGWWKEGEPFVYRLAYDDPDAQRHYPICGRREWRFFDLFAPSQKLSPTAGIYPLFVKPDEKLSVKDIIRLNRDSYEGTPYDLSKTLAGGPFECPVYYRANADQRPEGLKSVYWERNISVYRASYTFVSQSRSWLPDPIGGVLWFSEDMASTSVYMPIYCGVTSVPKAYSEGKRHVFDRSSAWWAFNFVSNWANLKYNYMIKDINAEQKRIENALFSSQKSVEEKAQGLYKQSPKKAAEYLTKYCSENMDKIAKDWWKLSERLIGKYCDGYVMTEEGDQENAGLPESWLKAVNYGATSNPDDPK